MGGSGRKCLCIGQLTSLGHDGAGTGQDVTFALAYNPAGQIMGRTVSNSAYVYQPLSSPGVTSYSNDALNRLTGINSTPVTSSDDFQITRGDWQHPDL